MSSSKIQYFKREIFQYNLNQELKELKIQLILINLYSTKFQLYHPKNNYLKIDSSSITSKGSSKISLKNQKKNGGSIPLRSQLCPQKSETWLKMQ